jgi:hypothetical protein
MYNHFRLEHGKKIKQKVCGNIFEADDVVLKEFICGFIEMKFNIKAELYTCSIGFLLNF